MPLTSPFESDIAKPGHGNVVLSLMAPANPSLSTLTYKYPLKLISRSPTTFTPQTPSAPRPVHLYLLTYGGGLLPGDDINVSITLEPRTRLVVTTPQGSTKIYKTEFRPATGRTLSDRSRQNLDVRIGKEAALCYLPDPAAPFKRSRYEQVQRFTVESAARDHTRSSLCVLDWVTQGRAARGENWDFHLWTGKNEIWIDDGDGGDGSDEGGEKKRKKQKLLLRDSLILDDEKFDHERQRIEEEEEEHTDQGRYPSRNIIRERTSPHGVVGTLILYGPVFERLGTFFMDRFTSLPRIGARNWASAAPAAVEQPTQSDDLHVTYTAARVRDGCVLVKFGAADLETAKDWLGGILREEGTVFNEFGEDALFCL